jgi:Flp pilus assembly protein TadD
VVAALKLDAQSPAANGLLGKILLKQGQAAEAVKLLEFAAAKKADDHELRYTLARAYQQLGHKEEAAREFAAVQKLKAEQLKKDRQNTPKP